MIKKDYYTCRVIENVEVDKHIYLSELINENNEVIQSNMYDEASTLIQVENYKYENGQLIKTHIIDKVFDVETLTTCTYLGDKIIEEKEHFLNDTFSATKYKYNGAGKLVSISQVDETGAILSQELYTYESQFHLIQNLDEEDFIFRQQQLFYDMEDKVIKFISSEFYIDDKGVEEEIQSLYTYQYDKRGNQIELEIDCYEKIIYYEKSKYDLKDQIIESEIWDHETDKTIFYIFEYDHLGNTILESGTQDGQLQFKIEHFYDHKGQLIRTDETNVEVDNYYVKIKNTIVQAIV